MAFHEDLKNYRLKQNITLEEISDRTKINIHTLRSFEEGDFAILPTTYVRLFLKAYAKEVGMGDDEVLRNYENEVQFAGQAEAQIRKETAKRAEKPTYDLKPKAEKSNQRVLLNNPNKPGTKKIIISGLIIILIIVFGKLAMNTSDGPVEIKRIQIQTPALALFHYSDSLKWGLSGLLSDSNAVEIKAKGDVTLLVKQDAAPVDTVSIDSGNTFRGHFTNELDIYAFPSRNVDIILIDQQLQPFNPGSTWTQLKVRGGESTLYAYALK